MTATDTVNNGAMGRLGFSFGFGGAPKKEKQAELAAIPTMNMGGNSLFELGNGQGITGEAADSAVLMAKRSAPAVLAPKPDNSSSELEQLRSRLSELEREIVELRAGGSDGTAEDQIEQLQALLQEKEVREQELNKVLASLQDQLNQQQKTIQLLLEKVELNAQR